MMFSGDYTVSDVASRYHVSNVTVLKWIGDGKLDAMVNYGCRPKYIITEEALKRFDRDYTARDKTKFNVASRYRIVNLVADEDSEEARLLKGLEILSDILEENPELKELILELADRG